MAFEMLLQVYLQSEGLGARKGLNSAVRGLVRLKTNLGVARKGALRAPEKAVHVRVRAFLVVRLKGARVTPIDVHGYANANALLRQTRRRTERLLR